MAYLAANKGNSVRSKPWRAGRRRDYVFYLLGYYKTKEEAEQREAEFDKAWPSRRGQRPW